MFLLCWWPLSSPCQAETKDAQALLLGMAQKVASLENFQVDMRMGYDVIQDNGQKIEFGEKRQITVKRPCCLRAEALQSDGDRNGLVYDGQTLTQFDLTQKIYTRLKMPGDIDHLIRYAQEVLDLRIPLALLLTTHLPKDLKEMTREVFYVEEDVLKGQPLDHIAGRTEAVDYQIWIDRNLLPRRIILTYRTVEGEPQFWANFIRWDLSPSVSDDIFRFVPPKGAEEVPFVIPAEKTKTPGK
jgi:hypothetical protein